MVWDSLLGPKSPKKYRKNQYKRKSGLFLRNSFSIFAFRHSPDYICACVCACYVYVYSRTPSGLIESTKILNKRQSHSNRIKTENLNKFGKNSSTILLHNTQLWVSLSLCVLIQLNPIMGSIIGLTFLAFTSHWYREAWGYESWASLMSQTHSSYWVFTVHFMCFFIHWT